MLFQHTLQQTTHDGDTHVGYFNTAVFAVQFRSSEKSGPIKSDTMHVHHLLLLSACA